MLEEKDLEIPDRLLAALTGLLNDPARLEAMSAAARTRLTPAPPSASPTGWRRWREGSESVSQQVSGSALSLHRSAFRILQEAVVLGINPARPSLVFYPLGLLRAKTDFQMV